MSDQRTDTSTFSDSNINSDRGYPIVRDRNFVRLPADDIVIIRRGIDYEISLIVAGPDPTFRADLSDEEDEYMRPGPVRLSPSFSEVARVRMNENTAAIFAMNLLDRLVMSGRTDIEALRTNIDAIIARVGVQAGDE